MSMMEVLTAQFLSEEGGRLLQDGGTNLPVIKSLSPEDKRLNFKPSSQVGQKEVDAVAISTMLR